MPSPQESEAEETNGDRRFLIAAGTARYANLTADQQLPSVPEDLQRIVALFSESGYEQVLPELSNDPTSTDLRSRLSAWFTHPDRQPTDIVVFYYSGHGYLLDKMHFLLTSESALGQLFGTAFRARDLGEMLVQAPLQRFLVILDTCYSGQGIVEITATTQTLLDSLNLPNTPGTGFYTLAATRFREAAEEHVFSLALEAAVRTPDRRYVGTLQPYLPLDALVEAINDDFAANAPDQHATLSAVNISSPPRFLRNPSYRPESQLSVGIDIETRQRVLSRYTQERVSHWGPSARGVESETQPGWYFTGRVNALRELSAWLSASKSDGKARVVTGDPGSGKSALLARLVTLSDPEYRRKIPLSDIPPETLPPEGCIQIALFAGQKTLVQLIAALAAETGIAETEPELLLAALAERNTPLTLVVDALDEAVDPVGVARRLLQPLTLVRCVKLLVGTRRPALALLGPAVVVLDLDTPRYIERADIQAYVQRRLVAADDPDSPSPYRGQPNLAGQVAEAVAERAFPVFLIARLISYELLHANAPVDPHSPTWIRSLPASVAEAFGQFLTRFGPDEGRVTDLLRPLAYAQGAGLPWDRFWAPLASALAGKSYADSDIDWLLLHAGAYIVEGYEGERKVYRLYHRALAEYLHRKGQDQEIHRRMVEALLAQPPTPNANGQKDWLRSPPYIRMHLAAHAAGAGLLGSLMSDPLYLIAADPDRLLAALSTPGCNVSREESHLYQAASTHLQRGHPPEETSSYLEMEARKAGMESMGGAIAALPLKRPWAVPWARWQREATHRTLQGHTASVTCVAAGLWQGRLVIVSGSDDSTVRVWDLATGDPIGEPLRGHSGSVNSVAVGAWHERTIIVSGGDDGTVRLWDPVSGAPIGAPFKGHESTVTSVVLSEFQGKRAVVSGSYDDTIRIWDMETGAAIGAPLKAFQSWVTSVDVGEWQGKKIIVSGARDGKVRVWDPATGDPICEPLKGHTGHVTSVALGERQGSAVLVSGGNDNTVRIWDLAGGVQSGEALTGHTGTVTSVDVGEWQGKTVIVSGSWDGTVRLWDLERRLPLGAPLEGHSNTVTSVVLGEWQNQPMLLSGSWDKTVRVWDPKIGAPSGEALPDGPGWVMSVAVGEWQGRTVVVSGPYDNTVGVWDLATGAAIGAPLRRHERWVASVALGEWQGRTIVVYGGDDAAIYVWDLADGAAIGTPLRGHESWVTSVALGECQGRTVIVSGSWDDTVRLWDVASGVPIGEPLQGHTGAVRSVAVGEIDERMVIVSGSKDETVRLWDFATGAPIGEPIRGHTDEVASVALGKWGGRTVIVSGGNDGAVRLWDPATGAPIGDPLQGHTGIVTSVAVEEWEGRAVIVSGGNDSTVRVWKRNGSTPMVIDVGTYVYSVAITTRKEIAVGTRKGLIVLHSLPVAPTHVTMEPVP